MSPEEPGDGWVPLGFTDAGSRTYMVTDWVTEIRRPGREWFRALGESGTEEMGRLTYSAWTRSRGAAEGGLQVRLVKRTAVITDEIVDGISRCRHCGRRITLTEFGTWQDADNPGFEVCDLSDDYGPSHEPGGTP